MFGSLHVLCGHHAAPSCEPGRFTYEVTALEPLSFSLVFADDEVVRGDALFAACELRGAEGMNGGSSLSWQQMHIWRAANRASNVIPPVVVRLRGQLDPHALRAAASSLVARHEMLRTTFHALPGGTVEQVVRPPFVMPVIETNLSGSAPDDAEARAEEIIREHGRSPHDLESLPLFRLGVITLSATDHILWFAIHHIVSDLWSTSILLDELGEMYGRHCQGGRDSLPQLRAQYSDYVAWQRSWLERQAQDEVAHWRRQLADLPDLSLPAREQALQRSDAGSVCSHRLPASLSADIRALARSQRTTPFMVLLAAFGVLLRRFVSRDSVAFEILMANRDRTEWERLIGMFAASTVFRADVSLDSTFSQMLAAVRDKCMDIYARPHLTFRKAVDLLSADDPHQTYERPRLLFTLQKTPAGEPVFHGLSVMGLRRSGVTLFDGIEVDAPVWDQTWQVWDEGAHLKLVVIFKCDLFDLAIVARLLDRYRAVLELAIASPGSTVAELTSAGDDSERSPSVSSETAAHAS